MAEKNFSWSTPKTPRIRGLRHLVPFAGFYPREVCFYTEGWVVGEAKVKDMYRGYKKRYRELGVSKNHCHPLAIPFTTRPLPWCYRGSRKKMQQMSWWQYFTQFTVKEIQNTTNIIKRTFVVYSFTRSVLVLEGLLKTVFVVHGIFVFSSENICIPLNWHSFLLFPPNCK